MLKLLIGGSPCTYWSIAQSTDKRETEPSGMGWELFKNYLIAKDKYNPDYFIYENNYSMDNKIREEITKQLGVEPIMINSALVSAQNRKRYYWTNIPNVTQPEDKGIFLKDILESEIDLTQQEKSYCLTSTYNGAVAWNTIERSQRTMVAEPVCVAQRGRYSDTGTRSKKSSGKVEQYYEARTDGKTNTLTKVEKDNAVAMPLRIGTIENNASNKKFDSQQYRVYSPYSKSVTICGQGGGQGAKTGLYAIPIATHISGLPVYEVKDGKITIKNKTYSIKLPDGYYIIRKLTVTECKRLQTVPDDYKMPCSKSQNYKMLGNGWTVDVISHILSFIPNLAAESVEVFSMYDGMSCGHIALEKLGANISNYYAMEIDKYAIKTTQTNYPKTIQLGDAFKVRRDDFKLKLPFIKITKEPIKQITGEQMSLFGT